MQITLKDIAEKLNLSVTAVSRALRNMPDISPETTELVQKTARELGYQKNMAASYLKTARSMTLGIVVPDICNPVFSAMYKGIEQECLKNNYALMLGNSNECTEQENTIIDNMIAHGVDGIFIVPSKESSRAYDSLARTGIPHVLLQRKIVDTQVPLIQSNDFEGGALVAEHLYHLGHRSFLLLFADMKISSAKERYEGFFSYLKSKGLDENSLELIECNSTRTDAYQKMKAKLEKSSRSLPFTAVFCFSDYIAFGAYSALTEKGFKIPDALSLVGYDNNEYSSIITPALTTVDSLPYEIGNHSFDSMIKLINNKHEPILDKTVISPRLIIRRSTKKI